MGFIKAFGGALSGTWADQWKDFYVPLPGVSPTAVVFPAVAQGTNAGRGENYKGSNNVITNGTKIIVPEGTALITIENGQITGFIAEAGGYEFKSNDPNSSSVFDGNFLSGVAKTFVTAGERTTFGGQASTQQLAFYINLKEIPNNKFGTNSEIYYDDSFFGTQVGIITRGTYTLKIVDPLLFVKNFVPATYLQADAKVLDLADMDNELGYQLFTEVISTLGAALAKYVNDPNKGNRISNIQMDQIGFAQAMSQAVEEAYQWKSSRGLEIVKTAIISIDYDEDTKELMKDVKKADALSGTRGNSFMQQAAARGIQAAGENGGGSGMAFMGIGMNAAGGMMGGMQQQPTSSSYQPAFAQNVQQPAQPTLQAQTTNGQDPMTILSENKKLLDAGLITQEDYDKLKSQLLGI